MADEIHQQMREDNSTRLRVVISALAMLYAMTFLGGFLQDTQYNFPTFTLVYSKFFFEGKILVTSSFIKILHYQFGFL